MKSWIAFSISAAAVISACASNPAQADPPQTQAQTAQPPAAPATAPKTIVLDTSKIQGFTAGAEVGTGVFGYELAGTAGAQTQRLMITPDRKYVLQWNGAAQFVGGVVANSKPYNPIYGVRAQAGGEAGIRILPELKLSPYVGAALAVDGRAVEVSGGNGLTTVNNTAGIGGVAGSATPRIYIGGSLLGSSHLAMLAFVQEQVLSPQTDVKAQAFTDIGLHVKYDIKDSLALSGEIWIGQTGENKDAALGTTTRTNRWGGSIYAIKTIRDHWFVGGGATVSREGNVTSNAGSALIFTTSDPVSATFGLEVGYHP